MINVHALGVGGYIPNIHRQTSCFLVEDGKHGVLLDLGSGVSRLLADPLRSLVDSLESLDVILSHFHMDHLVGLTWLPKFYNGPMTIYAPEAPLIEQQSATEALNTITGHPFFALPLNAFPTPPKIVALTGEEQITILGRELTVMPQAHTGGSIAIRIGDILSYVTDTDAASSEKHASFIAGSHLLIIDTMYDADHYTRLANSAAGADLQHGGPRGNAELALAAQAQALWLVHLSPDYSDSRVQRLLLDAQVVFPNASIPNDGYIVHID